MIENWLFVLAILAVLMIPGPANAMVASSAYQHGPLKTSLYIPAILVGYLYAINAWALLIHLFSPIWPGFRGVVHVLSLIWVGWMTFHFYQAQQLQQYNKGHPHLHPWKMFRITLKNPKAALLAAGILPTATWQSPVNFLLVFAAFIAVAVPVTFFWIYFGQALLANQLKRISNKLIYKITLLLLLLCLIPVWIKLWD